MLPMSNSDLIGRVVEEYLRVLERNNIPVWRSYLYGSQVNGGYREDSDIDIAVFWDKDEIDGFDEDVLLLKLTRDVDMRIEPHSFARTDFDETDPYIKSIIETGRRIA